MKKRNWKVMSLLMAGAMLAGSLTGCGSSPSDGGSSSAGDGSSSQQSEGQADQPAASGEVVDIKWAMVGNGMPDNYDAWKAKLDAYLEEKIGVHLDVEVVKWDDWGNRRSVMVKTNEDYDIVYRFRKLCQRCEDGSVCGNIRPSGQSLPGAGFFYSG